MKNSELAGRFSRVSKTDYRDGVVLVGFIGNIWPHDLTTDNIHRIKAFMEMPDSTHEFFNEWPEGIEPAYPAAKTNFKNGFMLLNARQPV